MPNYVGGPPFPRGLMRGDTGYSFGLLAAVAVAASPTGVVRAASGLVTLTTSVNHLFAPGEIATLLNQTSVGGTRFGGNYFIKATPSPTTATLAPLDDVLLHQAADTGGAGTAVSMQFESPAAPQAGTAFGLMPAPSVGQIAGGFSVDGLFSAAPGVFEVDIQVAQADVDSLYQTISGGNLNSVDPTNQTFHLDAPTAQGNFVRGRILTRTNAVGLILKIRG